MIEFKTDAGTASQCRHVYIMNNQQMSDVIQPMVIIFLYTIIKFSLNRNSYNKIPTKCKCTNIHVMGMLIKQNL